MSYIPDLFKCNIINKFKSVSTDEFHGFVKGRSIIIKLLTYLDTLWMLSKVEAIYVNF